MRESEPLHIIVTLVSFVYVLFDGLVIDIDGGVVSLVMIILSLILFGDEILA